MFFTYAHLIRIEKVKQKCILQKTKFAFDKRKQCGVDFDKLWEKLDQLKVV